MNNLRTIQILQSGAILLAMFFANANHVLCAENPTVNEAFNRANIQAWKNHIMPTEAEQAWTKIPWLPDLQSGIEAAEAAGKPILLWTMNGHPLGCT